MVRTDLLMPIKRIPERRGLLLVLLSLSVGLILACFINLSPKAGVVVLLSGTAFVFVILIRKTDNIIFGWFFLTSFFYFLTWNFFPIPPHYYRLLGTAVFWGLLLCAVAAWAIDNVLRGRSFFPLSAVPLTLVCTVVLFLLWSALNVASSVDSYHSFKQWSHILIALAVTYMFLDLFSRNQQNMARIFKVVSLLVMVMSFIMIAIAVQGLVTGTRIYKAITLWFYNPNTIGDFFLTFMPIMLTSGFYFKPLRGMRSVLLAIVLLALFFTFARTSWLGALCAIAFLLWKCGKYKASLVAAFLGLFVLGGMTVPLWREPVYDFLAGPRYTGRQVLWRAAWSVALDYPVLGTGLGTCQEFMNKYIEVQFLRDQNTHNLLLRNAADMGFFAAVLTLAVYALFFCYSWNIEKNLNSHGLRMAVRGAMASYVAMFVHDLFQNGTFLTHFTAGEAHIIWPYVLLAIPFAARRLENTHGNGGLEYTPRTSRL